MNGNEMKILRERLNWTQEQLGDFLTVNKATISNYENDKTRIPERKANSLMQKVNNHQETKYGSSINGDGNNVSHDSHNTYYGNEDVEGALCKFDKTQFSEIINLIKELNTHLAVKDTQIHFCTEQITKLVQERDELQKQLLEIYRTGQINRG
ncbi:MAG: helix-turn-helix domain-containing protein [Bacteroidales bacterium]|nr:helix-turn-helix domain-containing protein [Bacteroidales bacterium]MCQ2605465.1 helix-turn-helix domain-containing protein [Bacteroidales bacterium]